MVWLIFRIVLMSTKYDTSALASIIFRYFDTLSAHQKAQFRAMGSIYEYWNKRINLISRRDIEHLYTKHVLHSLSIAKIIAFQPNTQVLDVGTGGGFPGIPLAIMFPQTRFFLIDSTGKKIKAVQHIIDALGLTNVVTQQVRAENLVEKYDFVVGRAVTDVVSFCSLVNSNISSHNRNSIDNGVLYLKGRDNMPIPMPHIIYAIFDLFDHAFFETKQLIHLPHTHQA